MADPPKKPKPPSPDESGGLEEVERALSVLGGRHPEAVRAQREADEAKARREQARLADAARATQRGKLRLVLAAVGVVVVLVLVVVGFQLRARANARAAALRDHEARFVALGFAPVDDLGGTSVTIDADGPACFAVVADPGTSTTIDVTRGPDVNHVQGAALFCTCSAETVLVAAPSEVHVLRAAPADVGGVLALEHAVPRERTIVGGSQSCDVDQLAEWARTHAPKGEPSAPPSEPLAARGFVAEAGLAPAYPFVVLPAARDRCFVADAGAAKLTLVSTAKDLPAPSSVVAVCDAKGSGAVLRRIGEGKVTVASVPGARIGGVLGFREALAAAGVSAALWISDDDRAFFAEETLRASLVPEPKSVAGAALLANAAADARVVLVATKDGAMYVADGPPEATFLCGPTMSATSPESLCVQTKAHSWHLPRPDAVGALAYGVLPFWMSGLATAPANQAGEALTPALALLRLARRLSARGFDPSIVEGITERADGVDVLGRSGEDAVVVVGVWPAPPWTYTYTDATGAPWTLDDDPRALPLHGGEHLALVAKPAPTAPATARRTVVFRHATK